MPPSAVPDLIRGVADTVKPPVLSPEFWPFPPADHAAVSRWAPQQAGDCLTTRQYQDAYLAGAREAAGEMKEVAAEKLHPTGNEP